MEMLLQNIAKIFNTLLLFKSGDNRKIINQNWIGLDLLELKGFKNNNNNMSNYYQLH